MRSFLVSSCCGLNVSCQNSFVETQPPSRLVVGVGVLGNELVLDVFLGWGPLLALLLMVSVATRHLWCQNSVIFGLRADHSSVSYH